MYLKFLRGRSKLNALGAAGGDTGRISWDKRRTRNGKKERIVRRMTRQSESERRHSGRRRRGTAYLQIYNRATEQKVSLGNE